MNDDFYFFELMIYHLSGLTVLPGIFRYSPILIIMLKQKAEKGHEVLHSAPLKNTDLKEFTIEEELSIDSFSIKNLQESFQLDSKNDSQEILNQNLIKNRRLKGKPLHRKKPKAKQQKKTLEKKNARVPEQEPIRENPGKGANQKKEAKGNLASLTLLHRLRKKSSSFVKTRDNVLHKSSQGIRKTRHFSEEKGTNYFMIERPRILVDHEGHH